MKRKEPTVTIQDVSDALSRIFEMFGPMLYQRELDERSKAEQEAQAIQSASSGYSNLEGLVAMVLLYGILFVATWPNV